jgi:hypothetical protein
LYKYLEEIYSSLDNRKNTLGLLCDLSKAFDCVNHKILLQKLECYGVRGHALKLITSYLADRTQVVEINNSLGYSTTSQLLSMTCGLPQGSILGPLLFIIYINDLSCTLEENLIMYADDCSVKLTGSSANDLKHQTKTCLEEMHRWFQNNRLTLNIKKTNYIIFNSKHDMEVENIELDDHSRVQRTSHSKLLGITMDENLRWSYHVNEVCNKIARVSYMLRRLSHICSDQILLNVYYGFAYPVLKYNNIFWGNSSKTNLIRVFKLQKQALRSMLKLSPITSCRTLFQNLKILTFPSMIIYEACIFVRKHELYFATNTLRHNHNTRNRDQLITRAHSSTLYEKGPNNLCIKAFNSIPIVLQNEKNVEKFKSHLRNFLIRQEFYDLDHLKVSM